MPTNVLTTGTTAADSSDVTVVAGVPLTVCLKDVAGPAVGAGAFVNIFLKDDAGQYFKVGELTKAEPSKCIVAPGTYRFSRLAGTSCGVFSA